MIRWSFQFAQDNVIEVNVPEDDKNEDERIRHAIEVEGNCPLLYVRAGITEAYINLDAVRLITRAIIVDMPPPPAVAVPVQEAQPIEVIAEELKAS